MDFLADLFGFKKTANNAPAAAPAAQNPNAAANAFATPISTVGGRRRRTTRRHHNARKHSRRTGKK